ncbi:uncharacterized protein LOC105691348 [Athalia rosae]|uniref:uncharacterized protein LOC105691348 n=1 Tax=Athalia rosae TaxID=37344 RepID=UPI00203421AA|nr:uncharacterized protein LOC105691348 [Athalia rosae]
MLELVSSYVDAAWQTLATFGWYLVAIGVVLLYLSPQIKQRYSIWIRKREEAEYSAKYHKNVDLCQERLAGVEAARQRMQEKYAEAAKLAQQKEQERIEKKKQELLDLVEGKNVGQKLGRAKSEASTSNSTKQGYNPLMGDSSRGYRAPKRSCCGKGGCG